MTGKMRVTGKLPRICLLAAAETAPSVLYGLVDVLGSVGTAYREMTTGDTGDALIENRIVAASRKPFRCANGVLVEPDHAVGDSFAADVIIVCDMYHPIGESPHGRYPSEVNWLRRMHARGRTIASVCSGSLLLAEAGILDGCEAAGHWAYREMFRDRYPKVKFRTDAVLCFADDRQRIITAGGVNSWQELAIHFVARLCGRERAIEIAKIFLLTDRRDGQLPFAVTTPRITDRDAAIAASQTWIADNCECPKPVARMAERAGLTSRTFARRFRAATGYLPMDYVHATRIERAKALLESSDAAVDDIGHVVGYEDPASFRRLFKRETGLTPAAYRRRYASLLAAGSSPAAAPAVSEGRRGRA